MSGSRVVGRREILGALAGAPLIAGAACSKSKGSEMPIEVPASGPVRPLGATGVEVEPVSLGGEGILRTTGGDEEAVAMILEALAVGVRYCDTAPAYQESQRYYGLALRAAGAGARDRVLLASKTHARDRDGALALLDESLERLGTDHLDLWQLHDLRTSADLDAIFATGGAIEAVEAARADGRVRFAGITGHHDPAVLLDAMQRYDFHTVLCAMNPADPRRLPFVTTVVPEARRRGMGIIGMKALGVGRIVGDGAASVEELVRYAATLADTVIIGCSSTLEVRTNVAAGRRFVPMADAEQRALEARIAPNASRYDDYKTV